MKSCNLNHLRLFLEAYIANSLDLAGENLHVSHTAATQAIEEIERECGGPFYDRDKEGFHLTSRGLALVGRLTNFFEILDPALEAVSPNLKLGVEMSQLRSLAAVHEAGDFALAASLSPRRWCAATPSIRRRNMSKQYEGRLCFA